MGLFVSLVVVVVVVMVVVAVVVNGFAAVIAVVSSGDDEWHGGDSIAAAARKGMQPVRGTVSKLRCGKQHILFYGSCFVHTMQRPTTTLAVTTNHVYHFGSSSS